MIEKTLESGIILFDVDGTLVENSELSIASTLYAFEMVFGIILRRDEYDFLNMRFSDAIPKILADRNMDFDLGDLEKAVQEIMKYKREFSASVENHNLIQLAPGTIEILNYLRKQRFLIGVASNGFEQNIKLIMQSLGILNKFDYVHAESNITLQKPNHAPILKVMNLLARQIGIEPDEFIKIPSIMVGDTLNKDKKAVTNYNNFISLIKSDSRPMDFALVDLNDPESNNSEKYQGINYLGGDLRNLRNLLEK
jgi:beta-phosphoglucomutase-like phosphatase (HAD superfamily)